MSKTSPIEWTHSTFNPWWGCQKVSPACAHCYAEELAARFRYNVWGAGSPRRFFSTEHWDEPLAWNRQAERQQRPWRVFCGSICDILEDREDLLVQRIRLWELIERTSNLTWLLLTKRPERFREATPTRWWSPDTWPQNAWVGTTVESQEWADIRIPHLLQVPARVRFLSCEPLLGPLNLVPYTGGRTYRCSCGYKETENEMIFAGGKNYFCRDCKGLCEIGPSLSWVIAGGESGPRARPTSIDWARDIRDQCQGAGVPFFFKQWGEWSADGRRIGKQAAGRILDGREWDEVPA